MKIAYDVLIDAVAVLLGDYSMIRKQAAILILKMCLSPDEYKRLFENPELYPVIRNDSRVGKWTKAILSKGKCELCGSTERLEAHHILHWSDYPLGRIDVNNGQCLCHACHSYEHKDEHVYALMMSK